MSEKGSCVKQRTHSGGSSVSGIFLRVGGVVSVLVVLFVVTLLVSQPPSEAHSAVGAAADYAFAAPAVAMDGAEIYASRCQTCHQKNGQGVPGVFPPVDNSEWVTGDKGRLIRIILNGMAGEVEVNGTTYSGSMPPWGSFLSDEEVAQVSTYVRQSWSNDASEVTAEEVAAVRAATEDRKQPWTAEELKEFEGIPGQDEADEGASEDGK